MELQDRGEGKERAATAAENDDLTGAEKKIQREKKMPRYTTGFGSVYTLTLLPHSLSQPIRCPLCTFNGRSIGVVKAQGWPRPPPRAAPGDSGRRGTSERAGRWPWKRRAVSGAGWRSREGGGGRATTAALDGCQWKRGGGRSAAPSFVGRCKGREKKADRLAGWLAELLQQLRASSDFRVRCPTGSS